MQKKCSIYLLKILMRRTVKNLRRKDMLEIFSSLKLLPWNKCVNAKEL
jgi:hypothetical protein